MSVVYETGPGIARRYAVEYLSRVTGTWVRLDESFDELDAAKTRAETLARIGESARVIDTEAGDES